MTDIPLLALWAGSAALFISGVDSGKRSRVWLAAIGVSLASCVSYSGFCLVPLLGLYGFLRRDRKAIAAVLFLPAAIFAFWLTVSYLHYHRLTPAMIFGYYFLDKRVLSLSQVFRKFVYVFLALGGVTIFPFALFAFGRKTSILFGLALAAATAFLAGISNFDLLQKVLFLVLLCSGFIAMIENIRLMIRWLRVIWNTGCIFQAQTASTGGQREPLPQEATDGFFLGAWFLGVVTFCGVFYMTGSARYLLPATPPLVLILLRQMERDFGVKTLHRIAGATMALGFLLSIALAVADYQFARIYRDFASRVNREFASRGGGMWFTGEWGLRYYLEQIGGEELGRRDPHPKAGDLLIVPSLASPYETLFSNSLSLESVILVAPSRIAFDVGSIPPDAVLIYTIGMPYYDKSDGMNFAVHFYSSDGDRVLAAGRVTPTEGKRWRVRELPLREIEGKTGSIIFSAEVGETGNADADWVALARARIRQRNPGNHTGPYDFSEHLEHARVLSEPGVLYHTPGNVPVFRMTVWLGQEPAVELRGRYEYRPSLPIRLLDARSHAGFWSAGWGLLPFSFASGHSVLESISIYTILRDVDSYGEATPSWYADSH
jgi:hypothetical protein